MSEPTLRLQAGETAVVGYGSLLSRASVSRTLGRPYEGPFHFCRLAGWRRTWDVGMPNEAFYGEVDGERIYPEKILYLNVRPGTGDLNVALFVLKAGELAAMHAREWIYEPTVVTPRVRGVGVTEGEAIAYVGKAEHLVRGAPSLRAAAVRASYLRLLDRTLAGLAANFGEEYARNTEPVPPGLVLEDQLDPTRPSPWAQTGSGYTPESDQGEGRA